MIGTNYDMLEVLVSSIMAILLFTGILKCSKNTILGSESDVQFVKVMTSFLILNVISDMLTRAFDGSSLPMANSIVYATNYLIFLSACLAGALFMLFVVQHIYGYIHKRFAFVILFFSGINTVLLGINLFRPAVFYIDGSNCYKNGPLYYLFVANNLLCGVVAIISYIKVKESKGTLEFFSPMLYSLPVVIALILQATFPRVSAIIPMLSVSGVFIMVSLLIEAVYRDKLTGLYNRFYLDKIVMNKNQVLKKKNLKTALMMDVNGFKSINDTYGHEEGDNALINLSNILALSVAGKGKAIRYAGDEFVVVLNTQDTTEIEEYIEDLQQRLASFNQMPDNKYNLIVAIGYSTFDSSNQTLDEVMNIIDAKMFENKESYYEAHPEMKRR